MRHQLNKEPKLSAKDKRRILVEFVNAQKIESLGMMAEGITHDFNNMLARVMGNLSLLKAELPSRRTDWRNLVTEAMEATENSRALARQLVTFALCGTSINKQLNTGQLIKKASDFAVRGSGCVPKFYIPKDLWQITGDEAQLSQAIHNLIINSVQASPKGGAIEITAANEKPRSAKTQRHFIQLTVRDNGAGIAPGHLKNIFKPFYSTKTAGRGLGLTIAQSIIKHHHGDISAESSPGKGACFTIRLPADSPVRSTMPVPGKEVEAMKTGSGRVLIMEDDCIVKKTLSRMLARLGYRGTGVKTGDQALRAYSAAELSGRPFDVVILDLIIPGGMGGGETAGRLKKLYPGAKIIAASGYPDDPIIINFLAHGFDAALTKPYEFSTLASTLTGLIKRNHIS